MKPEFKYIREFTSTLEEVNNQVNELILLLDDKYESFNRFALDLVLRETLNNAVIHGNKRNSDLLVTFVFTIEQSHMCVVVEDQGKGFDWRSTIKSSSDPEIDHGRGFPILSSYCSDISLNEKGNRISFCLGMTKG